MFFYLFVECEIDIMQDILHQKETEIHAFPVLPLVMILFLPYNKTNSKKFGHAAAVYSRRNDEVNDEIHGD